MLHFDAVSVASGLRVIIIGYVLPIFLIIQNPYAMIIQTPYPLKAGDAFNEYIYQLPISGGRGSAKANYRGSGPVQIT